MVLSYYEFPGPRGPPGQKGVPGACKIVRGVGKVYYCPIGKAAFVCMSRCARRKCNSKRACISRCSYDKVRALCCG